MDLKNIDFHAIWNLEDTTKSFLTLTNSIDEYLQNSLSFTIEARFFKTYICMSDIKGNAHKDSEEATKNNEEAITLIEKIDNEPIRDGYKLIYLAMRCWLALKNDQAYSRTLVEANELLKKNRTVEEQNMFQASIHATKGFAFSRLSFGRYKESEMELKNAIDACPENVEWLFMFGLMTWRLGKHGLGKYLTSCKLHCVVSIMKKVLKLKSDHAYAMAISADIKRREYEHYKREPEHYNNMKGLIPNRNPKHYARDHEEKNVITNITDLLTSAMKNASRPKILSIVAQCYIRMGSACSEKGKPNDAAFQETDPKLGVQCSTQMRSQYFLAARDVIDSAKKRFNTAACILSQEAVLHREQNETKQELICLDLAIKMDPSNVGSRIQKAAALTRIGSGEEALKIYDNLPANFKDFPFAYFETTYAFAKYLNDHKQYDEAVSKNEKCLEIAFESFVKETTSRKVEFYEEQNKRVQNIIKYLKRNWIIKRRNDPYDIKPKLHLAELHENLRHYEDACCYYLEALGALLQINENHDGRQEMNIRIGLANVTLKSGNLSKTSTMLAIIDGMGLPLEENQKKMRDIKTNLAVAKGEKASKLGNHQEAIKYFVKATKKDNLEGAKGLLKAIMEIKDHHHFFKNCALIKQFIATATGQDTSMLENDLHKLVLSYDDGCLMEEDLKELRECQLEMEFKYLMDHENSCTKIGIVINKARSIFNYAVTKFRDKKYPEAKEEKSDFFIVYDSSAKDVEKKIIKKLKRYGWTDFRNKFGNLLKFLVSIQPATDPAKNNWLIAFTKLDNIQKHKHSLRLYKDRDGKMEYKDFQVIEIARTACLQIRRIVDEFCEYSTPGAN